MRFAIISLCALCACGFHGAARGSDAGPTGSEATVGNDGAPIDTPIGSVDAAIDASIPIDGPPFTLAGSWRIPCTSHIAQDYCPASGVTQATTIAGTSAQHYHVTVRIRGVMSNNTYQNGTSAGTGWYAGGSAMMSIYDQLAVTVSSPAAVYFINEGTDRNCCTHVFDYTAGFDIDGGATVTFDGKTGDAYIWENKNGPNGAALTVAGVTTTPDPYDGEFAQMDLLTIAPR